jgi:hypothetical protein
MRLRQLLHGRPETIAGTVYGTIVVLSMLTAGAAEYDHEPWRLVAIVASGTTVLWAAHVYSHGLGESIGSRRRLSSSEVTRIAGREASILLAGVLPVAAIALGALGVLSQRFALWLAFGLEVTALAVQGLRYARLERLGPVAAALAVAVNLAFGLVFVALKAVLAH